MKWKKGLVFKEALCFFFLFENGGKYNVQTLINLDNNKLTSMQRKKRKT